MKIKSQNIPGFSRARPKTTVSSQIHRLGSFGHLDVLCTGQNPSEKLETRVIPAESESSGSHRWDRLQTLIFDAIPALIGLESAPRGFKRWDSLEVPINRLGSMETPFLQTPTAVASAYRRVGRMPANLINTNITWREKTMLRIRLFVILAMLSVVPALHAQDWPQWRGPNYNGSTEAKDLPTEFSKTQNVKWAAPMPGHGSGTPIIHGNKVFVSSTDPKAQQLLAMCLDRKTGKVLWKNNAGSGYGTGPGGSKIHMHGRSNYASPSPVTDGSRVVFFFGNGDLVAYDLDGKKMWAINIQKKFGDFGFQWTFSSSPTLYKDMVIMQILQRDTPVHGRGGGESYVLALHADSGKVIWKVIRKTKAIVESRESFATPIPYDNNGREEIIIKGGDILTGHDPKDGKELWRWGTWNPNHKEQWWRVVPSPVVGNGVVLACAPKRAPVYAVSLNKNKADLTWVSDERKATSDVPTPLFYQGKFYVLNDANALLTCMEPKSGEVLWSTRLNRSAKWRASPTGADDKIYCINHNGHIAIVNPKNGKIINTIEMGDNDRFVRATIAVAHNNLFIRTGSKLYCIGK